eukprot:2947296-Ditylum_brightwellii.AAC.1
MRIYFHNVNGGLQGAEWGKMRYTLKQMRQFGVDIMDFTETNIPWGLLDRETIRGLMSQIFENQSRPTMSASNIPCVRTTQPGGTMTGIVGKHVGMNHRRGLWQIRNRKMELNIITA